ncbi:MAG: bacillithiol biosynthesis cysteine-adding enzyme BshC [Candidatus Aminicenantes bacterium]|nr:bacillithiol biosynthesis cysteine-adding enzyme BshC [Candidatus Aminicenantes bacterium]
MTIPIKDLPRLPRLVHDYFYDYGKVDEFYNGDFRDFAAFERQTERVIARPLPRKLLAEVLIEQNQSYGCGSRTLGHIQKIAEEKACAIVTGQQVGLFSGPLYTIYKALTAIKLAEDLNRRGLGSYVPVFWLASDDHDLSEIDHIVLLDKDRRLENVRCPMPSGDAKIPASNVILPPDILDCLRRLVDVTRDSEFKAGIIEQLADAYRSGRSMVEAFARWMTRLFASSGLIFMDAGHPGLKALGRDVFYREIAEESPSTEAALATSEKLRQAGYDEQIHLHDRILNIFYAEQGRRTIQRNAAGFEIKDPPQTFQKEKLLALATDKPFLFSPNVLLRPLYQDALLPTVAYIGGPGEIAYFAQMKGVYDRFELPMPVIYPRKSVTIVEKKIGHILKKYDLQIPEIWSKADHIIPEAAKDAIPESMNAALRLALSHLDQDFESLAREIAAFEPTLKNSAGLAQGRMRQQWSFLEKKILQAAKKRNEIAVQQLRQAIDNLYPNRNLQERVFNIVPYLIKYGPAFMDKLDQAVKIDEYDHQIMTMG